MPISGCSSEAGSGRHEAGYVAEPSWHPAGLDAHGYPSLGDDKRIVSWGKYGALTVHLYQVRDRDISASTPHLRHMTSLATPESLCQFTAADRKR